MIRMSFASSSRESLEADVLDARLDDLDVLGITRATRSSTAAQDVAR